MKPKLSSETTYRKNAAIYKIMANPLRLAILNLLAQQETTLMDMSKILEKRKSNISQHLALMSAYGLVSSRRDGRRVIYKITDPRIVESCKMLNDILGNE